MCELLCLISSYLSRIDVELLYPVVEKNPGARACLAVDKRDIRAGQVVNPLDPFRVVTGHNKTLLPDNKVYRCNRKIREKSFDV